MDECKFRASWAQCSLAIATFLLLTAVLKSLIALPSYYVADSDFLFFYRIAIFAEFGLASFLFAGGYRSGQVGPSYS